MAADANIQAHGLAAQGIGIRELPDNQRLALGVLVFIVTRYIRDTKQQLPTQA